MVEQFQCQNCGLIVDDTPMLALDLCPRCHGGHWQHPPIWREGHGTPNPFAGWKMAKSYRVDAEGNKVRVYPAE